MEKVLKGCTTVTSRNSIKEVYQIEGGGRCHLLLSFSIGIVVVPFNYLDRQVENVVAYSSKYFFPKIIYNRQNEQYRNLKRNVHFSFFL